MTQADGIALFKKDFHILGAIRRILWRNREHIHVAIGGSRRVVPRILHRACFEGNVQQVAVHRIRLLHRCLDRNVVSLGIGDHFRTARELRTE